MTSLYNIIFDSEGHNSDRDRVRRGEWGPSKKVNTKIGYYDFIAFVGKGYVPRSHTLDGATPPIKNAICYARGAYQGWLYNELMKKRSKMDKDMDNELQRLDAERNAMRMISKTKEPNSSWFESLVKNRATCTSLILKIEKDFNKMTAEKTLVEAYGGLLRQKFNEGNEINFESVKDSLTTGTGGNPGRRFNSLIENNAYEQAILENSWIIGSDIHNKFYNLLLKTCKEIHNSGIDENVQEILFGMALTFIISPTSMFDSMSMNIAILGPPGTGKTTIANKFAKLGYCLGWLCSDEMTVVTKSQIISHEPGRTALLTRDFLDGHIGECVFMDEAYSLVNGDPGQEFADELTAFITENKGMLMILVAGYVKEMTKEFFQSNIGLPRRFPTTILMEGKTIEQCMKAFWLNYTKKVYPKGKSMGSIQEANGANSRSNEFKNMEILAPWLPILNILLDFPVTGISQDFKMLLTSYFSDINELAQHYFRYMSLNKAMILPFESTGAPGHKEGAHPQYYFDKTEIIKSALNSWVVTKGTQWGIMKPKLEFIGKLEKKVVEVEDQDLIDKLDNLWRGKNWDKVVMSFEKIMWDSYKNNENKAIGIIGIGKYGEFYDWGITVFKGKTNLHLTGLLNKTEIGQDGTEFNWITTKNKIFNALKNELGVSTVPSTVRSTVPSTVSEDEVPAENNNNNLTLFKSKLKF